MSAFVAITGSSNALRLGAEKFNFRLNFLAADACAKSGFANLHQKLSTQKWNFLTAASVLGVASFCRGSVSRRRGRRLRVVALSKAQPDKNLAVVFVKPHANTPAVVEAVPRLLKERRVHVVEGGTVGSVVIDREGMIDRHYATIARVGMARDVSSLSFGPQAIDRFQDVYGLSLDAAITAGQLHTAATALEFLKVNPTTLLDLCTASETVKISSGVYVGQLAGPDGSPLYVLNGFYARMREKFIAPGAEVHWFTVTFDSGEVSWKAFRADVIGGTTDAVDGSLRAIFRDKWKEFGMQVETNSQDNTVHASAGPIEALRERIIWCGASAENDPVGKALLDQGFNQRQLQELLENPFLDFEGSRTSVFELLEDVDTAEALRVISRLDSKQMV